MRTIKMTLNLGARILNYPEITSIDIVRSSLFFPFLHRRDLRDFNNRQTAKKSKSENASSRSGRSIANTILYFTNTFQDPSTSSAIYRYLFVNLLLSSVYR